MQVDPEVLKVCVYIVVEHTPGNREPKGTGTLLKLDHLGVGATYLATARHVIERAYRSGAKVYIRINNRDGGCWDERVEEKAWKYHGDPNIDVAAMEFSFNRTYDADAIDTGTGIDLPKVEAFNITVGDETFIVGLFYLHAGETKNIPIVRIGNIAAMPSDPVATDDGASYPVYLIDTRSIGGLSGAPVFVNVSGSRLVENEWHEPSHEHLPAKRSYFWLGIIRGHYENTEEEINLGIAMVTPATKVVEVLFDRAFVEERKRIRSVIKSRHTKLD